MQKRIPQCLARILSAVVFFAGSTLAIGSADVLAQKLGEVPRVQPSTKAPRGEVLEWSSREGKPYWYRLPESLSERRAPNLVIMLHGTGVPHGWAFWNYPIANGTFRGGDIVIAPEGMTPGGGTSFNFLQGKKDGDQIAGLIREFRNKFPVRNVYVYGHSQGAFFAYWFAGAHPDLVDGICSHAGNVLNVAFPSLAKKKVAIGILHGKADAVVPVECAYRTEKIYKENGYEKVKLEIVEGLTERSGHWPLPRQVAEMFEWLDRVSVADPGSLAEFAVAEVARETPDLSALIETIERAREMLARYRGDDADRIGTKLEALEALVDAVEAAHIEALTDADARAKEFAPWMEHFRIAHSALDGRKEWKRTMRSLAARAKKEEAAVANAIAALERKPSRRAFVKAVQVLESSYLAPSLDAFEPRLTRYANAPAAIELEAADAALLLELTRTRDAAKTEGRGAADAITRAVAREVLDERRDDLGLGETTEK